MVWLWLHPHMYMTLQSMATVAICISLYKYMTLLKVSARLCPMGLLTPVLSRDLIKSGNFVSMALLFPSQSWGHT